MCMTCPATTPAAAGGADLVMVAHLLGHTRLESIRGYTKPNAGDAAKALDLLPVDH
jgi:hypothetical protein